MPADPRYLALRAELQKPDLAGLTDADAAAALAEPVARPPRPVPIAEVESLAFRLGVMARLYVGSESTDAGFRAACQTALALFGSRLTEVHLDDPATAQLLDALQAGTVLTADDRAALEALAVVTTSRAEAIPCWELPATEADVTRARSL
jgi:hypothetical protein